MKLQLNKTYVTNAGEIITLEAHTTPDAFYKFTGSNDFSYSIQGTIFENESDYAGDYKDNISHELQTEETSEVHIIDVLKFKQKSNGIKRKLILKDYSDETLEIIFKTKFSKEQPEVTNGLRLSYEGVYMLYSALEHLLDEHQGTLQ